MGNNLKGSYLIDTSVDDTIQPLKVHLQRRLFDEHLFKLSSNCVCGRKGCSQLSVVQL